MVTADKRKRYLVAPLLLLLLLISGFAYYQLVDTGSYLTPGTNELNHTDAEQRRYSRLKTLSASNMRELLSIKKFPNVLLVTEPAAITGNTQTDQYMYTLAERANLHLTGVPMFDIVEYELPDGSKHYLQPHTHGWLLDLINAASEVNIPLRVDYGYTSVADYTEMFLDYAQALGVNLSTPPNQHEKNLIAEVIDRYPPPGYSYVHTGLAVSFACADLRYDQFADSVCYSWLRRNNFENAKKYGWLPDSPFTHTNEQVANERPWQYVWVGRDQLFDD